MLRTGLQLLVLFAAPVPARIPHAASFDGASQPIALAGGIRGVLTDVDAGGAIWVRTAFYKARFAADGVRVTPVVGERAPGASLAFALGAASVGGRGIGIDRAAAPVLADGAVVYERGGLREIYRLEREHVEKLFVIDELPLRGAIELSLDLLEAHPTRTVPAAPPSAGAAARGAGIAFGAPCEPGIAYSGALTRDAAGRELVHDAVLERGAIVLRLPADFVRDAVLPLVVDPVLQPVEIDLTPRSASDPDVAFEPTGAGSWLVVYEDAASAVDHDVISRRFALDGTLLDEVAVDLTTVDSFDPAVAGGAGNFLIVWSDATSVQPGLKAVRGRLRNALGTAQPTAFDVQLTFTNAVLQPDVGGPAADGPQQFLVAWREESDLLARRVGTSGPLGAEFALTAGPNVKSLPAVAPVADIAGRWVVVHDLRNPFVPALRSVRAVLVSPAGTVVDAAQLGDAPASPDYALGVALHGKEGLATWSLEGTAGHLDVVVAPFLITGVALAPQPAASVTASSGILEERRPALAFDGLRYTIAYETTPAFVGGHDVRGTALLGAGAVIEGDVPLATTGAAELRPAIAAARDVAGALGRSLVVWEETQTSPDVDGALYTTLQPGGFVSVPAFCGPAAPKLGSSSIPAAGAPVTVVLDGASTASVILIGQPADVELCPGGCRLGVGPIAAIVAGAAVSTVLPADAALIGATVALQGVDLAPAGPGSTCGPPFTFTTLRLTDTLHLTVQ